MTPARGVFVTMLALALSAACTQVLDIEDAHVDASLTAGHAGSAGSQSGGNSAAFAGESPGSGGDAAGDSSHAGTSTSSNGGKSGSAGNAAAAGAPTENPVTSLCESYCDSVMANCKGKYEQYRSFDQCVEVCKQLPAGEAGDENVNSVQCRVRQATFAESEPFVYCKSAGPLGTGKCGSNCLAYCSLMQATCTAQSTNGNLEPSYYPSSQACLEACGQIPTHEMDPQQYSSSATAEPSCFVGNTVYCRVYHLASALEQGTPDEHCPHAMGGDPCIDQ